MAGIDNPELRRNLDPYYILKNDPWVTYSRVISMYLYQGGIRGFWPMNTMSNSVSKDFSPVARHLTAVNTPQVGIDQFTPYTQFTRASSEYASVADNADHDIVGTDTGIQSSINGLTMCMWVYFDSLAATQTLFGKWDFTSGNQRSYRLQYDNASGFLDFDVSVDGTAVTTASSAVAPNSGEWIFVAGRFDPSTELKIWYIVGGVLTSVSNTTSIPASIFNSTAALAVGRDDGGSEYLDGRAALCFLSAANLDDDVIFALFEHTRVLFRT
jgi:hypothetical protein